MTSRIGKPDTDADLALRRCLDESPVRSFIMVAGAGSGKTTSLVKALNHLAMSKGNDLRRRGQRIACITYTEVAVREIRGDIGTTSMFHVSTIHSFLWTIISPFQNDLRRWVRERIEQKVADAHEKIAKPRTQASTREKLALDLQRYERQIASLGQVPKFTYGTGSDYSNGVLGHDDILKAGPELIQQRPLLRSLVAKLFPFVFVDESQDTNPSIVAALRQIDEFAGDEFCLGFFGDPMQKIYLTGIGAIEEGPGWTTITKPENFRCPQRVLQVVNRIRAENDGLEQIRGRTVLQDGLEQLVHGTARLFVLPSDQRRTEHLALVRQWLARENQDPLWIEDRADADVRMLVLVHRIAARRLGFPTIYAALNDDAPSSLKDGLLDGTAWVLRPFLTYIIPLILALRAGKNFDLMALLRAYCPLFSNDELRGKDAAPLLLHLRQSLAQLEAMFDGNATSSIREALTFIFEQNLATPDDRFVEHFAHPQDGADGDSGWASVAAFLDSQVKELWGYREYIDGNSPFATQQGVKGAEFERVLAVLDDEESDYNSFSYGKYFGISPLSDRDLDNIQQNLDSVVDRTRRLFYVCCSRAVQDLAVVLFVPDVVAAIEAVKEKGIFSEEDILCLATMER
ncbi:UvrD-helicase domain-containing protein [Pseudomonas sp. TSRC2-2]|uniref:UvrD-helicase domain-containing protein n=1 Tax=unclassified Pseudomonas TaxID=196821 RepID=UPI003CED7453